MSVSQIDNQDGYLLLNADCLDCLKLEAGWLYEALTFDHVITDPPYEDRLHKAKSGGRKLRRDSGPELKALPFAGIDEIRAEFVARLEGRLKGWLLAFCTPEGVAPWADAINASPTINYKRACIWNKPDAAPQMNGQGPAAGYESFVCAWGGGGFSKWNGGGKRGVYTHLTNPPDRDGRHETEKPRRLMAELIADFTMPGDVVLDPFMGSATTGVAAIQLGRRFIGIEKDPAYYAIACERMAAATRQIPLFNEGDFGRPKAVKLL